MTNSQYAEKCRTCSSVETGLKYAAVNIVNDRESNTVCTSHIHLESDLLLCSDDLETSSHNNVESDVEMDGRFAMKTS
jgi:hypothetical protein